MAPTVISEVPHFYWTLNQAGGFVIFLSTMSPSESRALAGCKSRSPFSTHFSRLYPRGKGCILGTDFTTSGCVRPKVRVWLPSQHPLLRPKSAWRDRHPITSHDLFLESAPSTLLVPLLHGSCPSPMRTTPRFTISKSGHSSIATSLVKSRFVSQFQGYQISPLPVEITWTLSAMNARDSDYVPASTS